MSGLPANLDELKQVARAASENAYSPYSNIQVGAVAVGSDGRLYAGCNMENASYGLTQCAERNALAAAIAGGEPVGSISCLLVYSNGFETLSPCGACRQVLAEFCQDLPILLIDATGQEPRERRTTLAQLLPNRFRL